ncbi:MAG: hypothetical protein K6E50_13640 [Lachnospiraceae bacterium]|nr:hypothetical protein [Lachnospiraceae bacterium]
MKKRNIFVAGLALLPLPLCLMLGGCGSTSDGTDPRGSYEEEEEEEEPEEAEETPTPTEEPEEPEPEPEPEPADPDESDLSPMVLWEYDGYVDECSEYLWHDEFADRDYDGDGLTDRLYRTYPLSEDDRCLYTIEFGNGSTLELPETWSTGFPHIQCADLTGDGDNDIVFTTSYDTSTHPPAASGIWIFESTGIEGVYNYAGLPFDTGDYLDQCLSIQYDEPVGNTVGFTVLLNGFSAEIETIDEYLEYNPVDPSNIAECAIYEPTIQKQGKGYVVHCRTEPLFRAWTFLEYDLQYKGDKWEITNMSYNDEADVPW